jgi:hypothetical protein
MQRRMKVSDRSSISTKSMSILVEIEVKLSPVSPSIPGASIARSMSERSERSPRAREPKSQTRSTAGCRARAELEDQLATREIGRQGTLLLLRCSSRPDAAIARRAMKRWRQALPVPDLAAPRLNTVDRARSASTP